MVLRLLKEEIEDATTQYESFAISVLVEQREYVSYANQVPVTDYALDKPSRHAD